MILFNGPKNITNEEFFTAFLNTLLNKVIRRTTEKFAVKSLNDAIESLREKYPFLKYVDVQKDPYLEWGSQIETKKQLNRISQEKIRDAVEEITSFMVERMENTADFFFIRELGDAFERKSDLDLDAVDLDLNRKQKEFLINRKSKVQNKKDEMTLNAVKSLIQTANQWQNNVTSVKIVENAVLKLMNNFSFFSNVTIHPDSEEQTSFIIDVSRNINQALSYTYARGMMRLFEEVGQKMPIKNKNEFIDLFKKNLGFGEYLKLQSSGININKMNFSVKEFTNRELTRKLIEVFLGLYRENLPLNEALLLMKKNINVLIQSNHQSFQLFSLELNPKMQQGYSIQFKQSFEDIEDAVLGRDLSVFLKQCLSLYPDVSSDTITSLKQKLGKSYLLAFEKIGINFHLIDLKYQ